MTRLIKSGSSFNALGIVFLFSIVLSLAGVFGCRASLAAEATGWDGNDKSQLRLLAAPAAWRGEKQLFAGIEIRLAPKWKTYWRTPGDTGIPPEFDWSGSDNLANAEVLYPVPVRFKDGSGTSIGYVAGVTLPVRLTLTDPSKPVTLRLSANYAICYDLCVPVAAQHELTIAEGWRQGEGQRDRPIIEMALASVPVPMPARGDEDAAAGEGTAVAVSRVVKRQKGKPSLDFIIEAKGDPQRVDLFVEGPGGLYVPMPERKKSSGEGDIVFSVDLTQVDDPAEFDDAALTCTVKADEQSVVQPCSLK